VLGLRPASQSCAPCARCHGSTFGDEEKTLRRLGLRARTTDRFAVFRLLRSQPVRCKTHLTCGNSQHPPLSPSPKRNSTMLDPHKAVAKALRALLASLPTVGPCWGPARGAEGEIATAGGVRTRRSSMQGSGVSCPCCAVCRDALVGAAKGPKNPTKTPPCLRELLSPRSSSRRQTPCGFAALLSWCA
jgi:hypothetical protein